MTRMAMALGWLMLTSYEYSLVVVAVYCCNKVVFHKQVQQIIIDDNVIRKPLIFLFIYLESDHVLEDMKCLSDSFFDAV